MKNINLHVLLAITVLLFPAVNINAQEKDNSSPVSVGADLVSRFVWRGTDFGGSPSIQPNIEADICGITLGAWGAYTTNAPGVQEADLYISRTIADLVSVGFTDYFYPDNAAGIVNYFSDSTHVIELNAGLSAGDFSFSANVNLMNDDDHSLYFEAGYSFEFIEVFVGAGNGLFTVETAVPGYDPVTNPDPDDDFMVINFGASASKDIKLSDSYSMSLSCSFIVNPYTRSPFLVLGISF
jgi:hypothetical protein